MVGPEYKCTVLLLLCHYLESYYTSLLFIKICIFVLTTCSYFDILQMYCSFSRDQRSFHISVETISNDFLSQNSYLFLNSIA